MKKLFKFVGIAFAGVLALASCKNSEDLESLRKDADISAEIKEAYNINFDATTSSKKLYNQDRGDNNSYFDVYVAEDYKNSLLSYTITLESMKADVADLEKRLDQNKVTALPINTLMFSSSLYSSELSSFINEIYNSNYGINSTTKTDDTTTKNYDFGFDIDSQAAWTRSLTGKYLNEAYLDGKTDISIVITYLPLYLNRYNNGNEIVKLYAFLPISEAAVVDGKKIVAPVDGTTKYSLEDYTIAGKAVNFKFDEDNKLLLTK